MYKMQFSGRMRHPRAFFRWFRGDRLPGYKEAALIKALQRALLVYTFMVFYIRSEIPSHTTVVAGQQLLRLAESEMIAFILLTYSAVVTILQEIISLKKWLYDPRTNPAGKKFMEKVNINFHEDCQKIIIQITPEKLDAAMPVLLRLTYNQIEVFRKGGKLYLKGKPEIEISENLSIPAEWIKLNPRDDDAKFIWETILPHNTLIIYIDKMYREKIERLCNHMAKPKQRRK